MKRNLLLLISCLAFATNTIGQSLVTDQSLIASHILRLEGNRMVAADFNQLEITDQHIDKKGIKFIYIRQQFLNKPVFNGIASIAMVNSEVVHVASELVDNLVKRSISENFSLNYAQALNQALAYNNLNISAIEDYDKTEEKGVIVLRNNKLSDYPIELQMGFLYTEHGLLPVWKVWVYTLDHKHLYLTYIQAESGTVIRNNDLVLNCSFDGPEHHVHSVSGDKMPVPAINTAQQTNATNSYKVLAWPVESPNHGSFSTVTDPAEASSSPFGWHDINGLAGAEYTSTRGNNVWARDDKDANNTGGTSPDGGTDLVFDAPFDITKSAELQLDAATINLFYWNNLMHDVFYHYGFDPASGNFQENNYGLGGVGSDFVFADAQDGSGTNNANFSPLPEGQNPRMQMFLWAAAGGGEAFVVTAPSEIAGSYNAVQAGFGNQRLSPIPVKGKLVLVNDGTATPTLACSDLVNAAQISGNIALIYRGSCNFDDKILWAQAAGAIAVVMVNNVAGSPIVMGGDATTVNISSVMISQADGNMILNKMSSEEVNVSLYDSSTGGTFYYDSDFDNGVIVHEYTHGISTRLTGGPSNSSCLTNVEQMGEGWSDFLSLVMTHAPAHKGEDKRGIGTYLRNESIDGAGIRPYPYSTNFTINPVTYDYIKLTQFTVPHGVGSVWCSMLWDLYWAFIDVYGYDSDIYKGIGGNNMVMHLVMDGLKLQPCNPGFIDGRDAILKADELLNGGKNKLLIWQVFAKRGLGYSAKQGSSQSKTDGTQAFDLPPSFGGYAVTKKGPKEANAGDTIYYEVVVKNIGDELLKQLTLQDSLSVGGRFIRSDGRCNLTFNNNTFSLSIQNLANRDSVVCGYFVAIDTSIGGKNLLSDDFETDTGKWINTTIKGSGGWARRTGKANSGSFSYFVDNPASESDRTLSTTLDLTKVAEPHLIFSHLYNSEDSWDGAVVELLVQGIWQDLNDQMMLNGYNGLISNNPASSISNRPAFTGNSQTFVKTIVNLKPYAGNVVDVRFRFVSDGLQGGEGWYLDDVALWNGYGGLVNKVVLQGDGLKAQESTIETAVLNQNVSDSVIVIIDVNEELVLFPNPAGNTTKVRFGSKVERTLGLEMMDMTGKLIWDGEIEANNTIEIPIHGFSDGMYVLRVLDRGAVRHIKLIKRSR